MPSQLPLIRSQQHRSWLSSNTWLRMQFWAYIPIRVQALWGPKCQRIDVFKLWCWIKLLRAPCNARRLNESILKEINPEYSLEGLMLKLELQYFAHVMQRANSLEKTLMLGKVESKRIREWQRMSWLDGITNSWTWVNSGRWWGTGKPGMLQSMGLWSVGHYLVTEQQQHGIKKNGTDEPIYRGWIEL